MLWSQHAKSEFSPTLFSPVVTAGRSPALAAEVTSGRAALWRPTKTPGATRLRSNPRLVRLLRFVDVHVLGVDHVAFFALARPALRRTRPGVRRAATGAARARLRSRRLRAFVEHFRELVRSSFKLLRCRL